MTLDPTICGTTLQRERERLHTNPKNRTRNAQHPKPFLHAFDCASPLPPISPNFLPTPRPELRARVSPSRRRRRERRNRERVSEAELAAPGEEHGDAGDVAGAMPGPDPGRRRRRVRDGRRRRLRLPLHQGYLQLPQRDAPVRRRAGRAHERTARGGQLRRLGRPLLHLRLRHGVRAPEGGPLELHRRGRRHGRVPLDAPGHGRRRPLRAHGRDPPGPHRGRRPHAQPRPRQPAAARRRPQPYRGHGRQPFPGPAAGAACRGTSGSGELQRRGWVARGTVWQKGGGDETQRGRGQVGDLGELRYAQQSDTVVRVQVRKRLADATAAYLDLQCGGGLELVSGGLELVMHVSNTITDRTRDGLFDSSFLRRTASMAHAYLCARLCVCISLFSKRGRLATC